MIDYQTRAARTQQPIAESPYHEYIFDDGTIWTEFYRNEDGYILRFPRLADFHVSLNGHQVTAFPAVGTDDITVEHLYINQMVPLALSRQGQPTYHASVVAMATGAIAFIGKSGMGKSTLAASFALNDADFLTDDALLIKEQNDACLALPSHASLRLWEDSVEALAVNNNPREDSISYSDKTRLLAGEGLAYCSEPKPLIAAYVLQDDNASSVSIQELRGLDRYMAWQGNSFLLDVEDAELLSRHFEWTHRISTRIPTYTLDYSRDYGMLPAVRSSIRNHANSVEQTNANRH